MEIFILISILVAGYALVSAKRMSALITCFRLQALLLCMLTFLEAVRGQYLNLYIIALLVLLLKVFGVPYFLFRTLKTIKVSENLGCLVNPQLSLLLGLVLTYFCWVFAGKIFPGNEVLLRVSGTVAFSTMLFGFFIMVARLKALAQIIGLVVMENGIFLLASAAAGGMPFLVEMAIFFDVFVSVVILGLFVYRINELFTGIDVNQLNRLRG